MESAATRVRREFAAHFCIDLAEVTPQKTFVGDLDGDSLDRVEVVMRLEEEFGIVILDDEAMACSTVGDFVALVEKQVTQ